MKLGDWFTTQEMECKDHCGFGRAVSDYHPELIKGLNALRELAGVRITVTSGCRCADRNAQVPGSATKSRHMLGQAADIKIEGLTAKQMYALALKVPQFRDGGIGLYSNRIHVDVGPKRRW